MIDFLGGLILPSVLITLTVLSPQIIVLLSTHIRVPFIFLIRKLIQFLSAENLLF